MRRRKMNFLSIDLEATGLKENDFVIEVGVVPLSTDENIIHDHLSFHSYVKCPNLESLRPHLDEWVIEHNSELIEKAHQSGATIQKFKEDLINYLNSPGVSKLFNFPKEKIVLLGKSLNAIDLPFLTRDLGWQFMREHFHHQVIDISSITRFLIDSGHLPQECISGSELSNHLNLGEVSHTALEDAIQTAQQYFSLLNITKI